MESICIKELAIVTIDGTVIIMKAKRLFETIARASARTPKLIDPMSPMNTLAGLMLKYRKTIKIPIKMA